jgi:single-stranded-DNA-specific exonuclease
MSRHVQVIGTPRVVGNGHVRMKLRSNGVVFDGIAFRMLQKTDSTPHTGEYLDAIYTPTINRWNNKENIQVFIKGLRSPCTV